MADQSVQNPTPRWLSPAVHSHEAKEATPNGQGLKPTWENRSMLHPRPVRKSWCKQGCAMKQEGRAVQSQEQTTRILATKRTLMAAWSQAARNLMPMKQAPTKTFREEEARNPLSQNPRPKGLNPNKSSLAPTAKDQGEQSQERRVQNLVWRSPARIRRVQARRNQGLKQKAQCKQHCTPATNFQVKQRIAKEGRNLDAGSPKQRLLSLDVPFHEETTKSPGDKALAQAAETLAGRSYAQGWTALHGQSQERKAANPGKPCHEETARDPSEQSQEPVMQNPVSHSLSERVSIPNGQNLELAGAGPIKRCHVEVKRALSIHNPMLTMENWDKLCPKQTWPSPLVQRTAVTAEGQSALNLVQA